ncbi:hypothetical protein ACFLTP_04480 [Chloroflexota bacterium]
MSNKTKISPQELIDSETCSHYWVIETPNGDICNGICLFCGEKKEFISTFENLMSMKTARKSVEKDVSTEDEYFS